jgi:hypothetical protein
MIAFKGAGSGSGPLTRLRRDIISLSESKRIEVEAIAKRMLADQKEIFIWWHMFRDGETDRQCLRAGTAVIQARFKRNFQALAKTKEKRARTFGSTLTENWSQLWTFTQGGESRNDQQFRKGIAPAGDLQANLPAIAQPKGPGAGVLRAGIFRWTKGANQE